MTQQHVETGPFDYRDAEYMWRVRDYKSKVHDLHPEIPHQLLDHCTIFTVDTLVAGYFLEGLDDELTVYEVGSFAGVSTYLFASHPKVSRIVCIDPNSKIADEAVANSKWAKRLDLEAIGELRVFDVAREVFASLDRLALDKVQFVEGVVGSERLGAQIERKWSSGKAQIPSVGSSGEGLVAYVDGLRTREGVGEALSAVFRHNPRAIAILDDCRHRWGPLVQAGVVDFMEGQGADEYTFRLFGDLGPGMANSGLGLLYHRGDSEEKVNVALRHLSSKFSWRLDPVQLLIRENQLMDEINHRIDEISRISQTNRENTQKVARLESLQGQRDGEHKHKVAQLENLREQRDREHKHKVARLESLLDQRDGEHKHKVARLERLLDQRADEHKHKVAQLESLREQRDGEHKHKVAQLENLREQRDGEHKHKVAQLESLLGQRADEHKHEVARLESLREQRDGEHKHEVARLESLLDQRDGEHKHKVAQLESLLGQRGTEHKHEVARLESLREQRDGEHKHEVARLENQTRELTRANEFLTKKLQRRIHRAAEAVANSVARIPGIRGLLIRKEQ